MRSLSSCRSALVVGGAGAVRPSASRDQKLRTHFAIGRPSITTALCWSCSVSLDTGTLIFFARAVADAVAKDDARQRLEWGKEIVMRGGGKWKRDWLNMTTARGAMQG